jgi:hypothetical protein
MTGVGLIILGIVLSPIIIGIPIMVLGFLVGDFGILLGVVRIVPGLETKFQKLGRMIVESYKPYLRKEVKK